MTRLVRHRSRLPLWPCLGARGPRRSSVLTGRTIGIGRESASGVSEKQRARGILPPSIKGCDCVNVCAQVAVEVLTCRTTYQILTMGCTRNNCVGRKFHFREHEGIDRCRCTCEQTFRIASGLRGKHRGDLGLIGTLRAYGVCPGALVLGASCGRSRSPNEVRARGYVLPNEVRVGLVGCPHNVRRAVCIKCDRKGEGHYMLWCRGVGTQHVVLVGGMCVG